VKCVSSWLCLLRNYCNVTSEKIRLKGKSVSLLKDHDTNGVEV
jgi:hypothetical protein